MDLVRRIYLYAMSAVALGVLGVGLQVLLTVVLHAIGLRGGTLLGGDADSDRRALSLAISLVGVGLPVWAIHWYLVERGLGASGPGAERERTSAIRALYLSGVLAILLLVGAQAGADLIRFVLQRFVPEGEIFYGDAAASLATLVVAAAGWALHAWTRLRDVSRGELRGAAAWWPRAYRYGVAFGGLWFFLNGLGALAGLLVEVVGGPASDPLSSGPTYGFLLGQAVPGVLLGFGALVSHAWASERLARGSGWHGASERASRVRLAQWPLVVGVAAITAVSHAAEGLRPLLARMLGDGSLDFAFPDQAVAITVAAAAGFVVPWLAAWWLYRRWARADAATSEVPGRPAFLDRLDEHIVAAVGLGFGAVGIGWLAGIAIDVALGGNRAVGASWRLELGQYLAFAVLGLPFWIWNWSRLAARRAADPAAEAGSPVRRTYLLLAVGVSILSTLGSLAIVLYRFVGALLGTDLGGNAVSELSTPLGALAVAAVVVVYHGLQLRADQDVRAATLPAPDASPAEAAGVPAPMPVTEDVATVAHLTLVLTAPADADIASTLISLRSVLPEGQSLDEA